MSTVVSDIVGKLQQVLQGCGGRLTPRCVCVPLLCFFSFLNIFSKFILAFVCFFSFLCAFEFFVETLM